MVADVGLASISTSVPRVQTIDPRTEFKPITDLFTTSFVIVAKPDRFNSLPELIKKAAQQPGRLNYGSAGSASGQRLSIEMLKARTQTHITFIPYRGNAEALTALISGDVDLISIGLPPVRAHLESGRLKALATTAPARSAGLPGLLTVNEALNIKGYAAESWVGLYGPPGMAADVAERIQRDVATAMRTVEIEKFLKINDYQEGGSSPGAFAARMERDREKYRALIQELKLSFD
ncbi:MAG: tripartite tricarboxylate transporter substrate binding protein [Betaproteobacteria bacterium]|nr:tripartite tricarboxylate transporter substrate binding protein [Betaproteobacteria bacterium]